MSSLASFSRHTNIDLPQMAGIHVGQRGERLTFERVVWNSEEDVQVQNRKRFGNIMKSR